MSLWLLGSISVQAQPSDNRSDSVDVLHYELRLDAGHRTVARLEGSATLVLRLLQPLDSLTLELCPADIDSVWINGVSSAFRFDSEKCLLQLPVKGGAGDTVQAVVFYRKGQYVMKQGWGGFYFDNSIYYNLGCSIYDYPHNAGKAWFPCRDNFYDKATYRFEITAKPGWMAICSGLLDTVLSHADGSSTWCWELSRPIPTYLAGIAVAPFRVITREVEGIHAGYPAMIGFLRHDSIAVETVFAHLDKVIPQFERCFGPYRWERIGYVTTPKGSMEHADNIALVSQCAASPTEPCLATMCHELAHAWFGNLVTCAGSEDMWINEGGASFCEELAIQAITSDTNPLHYRTYARNNLKNVLMQTHLKDGGFKPLYGQEPAYTYGSTVYNKGATVWHSLRGYLGDSIFYSSMRNLFARCAFMTLDSRQLRDSLSLYSGTDLTAFFDFHVFQAGFNDYVIDSMRADLSGATLLHLRQKPYGTTALLQENRVWVSFFSADLQEQQRLVTFEGAETTARFQLPFQPKFAIVDREERLSTASIGRQLTLDRQGTVECSDLFMKLETGSVQDSAWLHISHHWSRPDSTPEPWFYRFANRHWRVTGIIPERMEISAGFYYCRFGDDAVLDEDFIRNSKEMGNVCLLYRKDAGDSWKALTRKHTGVTKGYFVIPRLQTGEYTLAIMDTTHLEVAQPLSQEQVKIYPNPSSDALTIETGIAGEALRVDVCDMMGKMIYCDLAVSSGASLSLSLPNGPYLFIIHRTATGEALRKMVQIMHK